ncbi:MAG TPA: serine hydrolase [Nitriliruptoraceae bacterium]|nr:serine hydrolase [Nitriliruptoraceae bacterium]
MQRMGRNLAIVIVVVAVIVAGAGLYLRPIAPVATGYAAQITCGGALVAGRSVESASADLPSNPLVPFLRISASEDSVTTSLLGLWDSTSWYTPGVGCTLADEDPGFAPVLPAQATPVDQPWPSGNLVDLQVARDATGVNGAALDLAVEAAFTEDDPDGQKNTRAVVVVHGGQVVAEEYAPGFDADTPLLGWSMGKSVANAIVGRLVHDGQVDLDAAGLRPEWANDERSSIQLDQLLRMESGLAFDESYDPNTDATNMLFTPGSTADFAAAKPLEANPGTYWSYSSGTSNIVCDVAHRTSGMGVEMARELVFDPLGMDSAVMEADDSGELVCSSFPYATARDWARFGQWFLQAGVWDGEQLLPEDWIPFTTDPVTLDTENPYGAHWWLNTDADGTVRMPDVPGDAYWASGNEGQQVVVIPSLDTVVVRLGFTSDFGGVDWGLEDLISGVMDGLPAGVQVEVPAEEDAPAEVVTEGPSPSGTTTATPSGTPTASASPAG